MKKKKSITVRDIICELAKCELDDIVYIVGTCEHGPSDIMDICRIEKHENFYDDDRIGYAIIHYEIETGECSHG